ncbi:uncharacterized protein LOC111391107 [Olea europaea var. sylvestris]|uniref:uncharacterized protein LOC111391107 n=1 Tax=Olea europaea var. sylvestris TaxID=158386 RepID=UPI000C1D645D|nr:uncharacterized protein LOC111391107 [Olea europaea var. sylvestris]
MEKVNSKSSGVYFIGGPGGSCKTFLYEALLAGVRSQNLIALATASSGVSASLLPGGRTAHSRFKIPLEIVGEVNCSVSKQSTLGTLLKMSNLILQDKAPMVNRCAVETVDIMLRDIIDCNFPFDGKVVVLGGDFQQVLPISDQIYTYYNFDEAIDKSKQSLQEDLLNTLTPNGIPPHELEFKINYFVMLLWNINHFEGLCNRTCLTFRKFNKNVILAGITTGEYCGKYVFLLRIPFVPLKSDQTSISFKRHQFPIRPCFAMMINKAQGQTLDFVGLYLPELVFSHGQLYVALSRAKTSKSFKVLLKPLSIKNLQNTHTKNIVYKEILSFIRL